MTFDETRARRALVDACRDMTRLGLTQGTSGNISVRAPGGLLITPSGLPYDEMTPGDIVPLSMDGSYEGSLAPSSEWRFHRDILAARVEVGAVVHAHPAHATAFALCRQEILAVHYMIAAAGGPTLRCAGYATFGTSELSALVLQALEGRHACLMANHGMVATGPDLAKAMWLAVEVETLCSQYALALRVGTPHVLPDEEIARVLAKFATYGPRAARPARSTPRTRKLTS